MPFALRYLFAAHPQAMGKVLGIVYRAIATHLIYKAGFHLKDDNTGAVTLIQRFGSASNLNILCGAPHKILRFSGSGDGQIRRATDWPPGARRYIPLGGACNIALPWQTRA